MSGGRKEADGGKVFISLPPYSALPQGPGGNLFRGLAGARNRGDPWKEARDRKGWKVRHWCEKNILPHSSTFRRKRRPKLANTRYVTSCL